MKFLTNCESLLNLWDMSLQGSLQGETHARIMACEGQMKSFEFFYGLNLAYHLYAMIDTLSNTIQKESLPAVDSQSSMDLILQAIKGLRTGKAVKLFCDVIEKNEAKHDVMEYPSDQESRKDLTIKRMKSIFFLKLGSVLSVNNVVLMMTLCLLSTKCIARS